MRKFTLLTCLTLTFVFAGSVIAAELPERVQGHDSVYYGGNSEFSKSNRDSVFLIGPWGSGAQINGQFQDLQGTPAWNGWTSWDATVPVEHHWQVSDYSASNLNSTVGNLAAFCGDATFISCDPEDPVGGYGNNYDDILEYRYVVYDAGMSCTVTVDGIFNSNTEPGYDYTIFRFETADALVVTSIFDGIHSAEHFLATHTYGPADYVGGADDEVSFQIVVTSDGGWSDEDCNYWSNGACQVDDISIHCTNGNFYDFADFQDGTFGSFSPALPIGVGDFAGLWTNLEVIDPCRYNYSAQVAFIDDGTQVQGVGPSYCQNWCYGPGGYIVNTTGGADPDGHLLNLVDSPVLTWPGQVYTGVELEMDIYRHEDLSADAPGIFYNWGVRSTDDEISSPIALQPWVNRNFVYYGGPDIIRAGNVISDLIVPGATHAQVQLECKEYGYVWGWDGDDGYPAPYFDNVSFKAFQILGPGMSTREIDMAQDNFSEIGEEIDFSDLAINNVRFDGAQNKAIGNEEHNIPGDSITCNVASARVGGQLVSNRLIYTLQRNPVFDSVRDANWAASGFTDGIGDGLNSKYYYDLPDSGFLFPGDVLHYYFEATDEVGHADPQTTTLPADISGFGDFSRPMAYNTAFQVHALPSVEADGMQPSILFWNDFANRGGENKWFGALNNLGMRQGRDYDVYYTNGPSSGVGNGLGGRAVYEQIKGYTELLYTCGDLSNNTISNGNYNIDPSRDIHLLMDWFAFGEGRSAFMCGDGLVGDLNQAGALTSSFVSDLMNLQFDHFNLRSLINNQTTPLVIPVPENSVFHIIDSWIAYGGCFGINTFDAVVAGSGAERLAQFANPSGAADYNYSAATLNLPDDDRIITMPYDFMYLYTDPDHPVGSGMATRVHVLREILTFFQVPNDSMEHSDVPGVEAFFARNYPNPFNPATRIEFNLPETGHLKLKIYNVRGELVKTLIDETRPAGADFIMWDGTNEQNSHVSSGVYFYEARTGGKIHINKMALVK